MAGQCALNIVNKFANKIEVCERLNELWWCALTNIANGSDDLMIASDRKKRIRDRLNELHFRYAPNSIANLLSTRSASAKGSVSSCDAH